MPTTPMADVRRPRAAPRRSGAGRLVALALAGAAAAGGAVAYSHHLTAVPGMAPADTLAGTADRFVDAVRRVNDALDDLKSPADLPARAADVGPRVDAVAGEIDRLLDRARTLPPFDEQDVRRVYQARIDPTGRQTGRWQEAMRRLFGSVTADSPLASPLLHAIDTMNGFWPALHRIATGDRTPPPTVRPPTVTAAVPGSTPLAALVPRPPLTAGMPPPPSASDLMSRLTDPSAGVRRDPFPDHRRERAEQEAAEGAAARRLTVYVRGLSHTDGGEGYALAQHLRRRLPVTAAYADHAPGDQDHVMLVLTPGPATADQVAAAVDFGSATVAPDGQSVVVDADPARVADIAGRPPPPAGQPSGGQPSGGQPSGGQPSEGEPSVRVKVGGVRNRSVPLADDARFWALVAHLRQGLPPDTRVTAVDDADDVAVTAVTFRPMADLDAVARQVDFGASVVVQPAARAILVDADPAKVEAIVRAAPTPPDEPPADFPAAAGGPPAWVLRLRRHQPSVPMVPPLSQRFPADQIVTVHLRGLADRDGDTRRLMDHLFALWPTAHNCQGHSVDGDPAAEDLQVAAVTDVAAAAARIDFGRAVADPVARTVTVDVDAAKVAALVTAQGTPAPPAAAPPAVPPPAVLPHVVPVGTKVAVRHGTQWVAATVLAREGRRYRVHYDGWSDADDEWVGTDRMRPADGN